LRLLYFYFILGKKKFQELGPILKKKAMKLRNSIQSAVFMALLLSTAIAYAQPLNDQCSGAVPLTIAAPDTLVTLDGYKY